MENTMQSSDKRDGIHSLSVSHCRIENQDVIQHQEVINNYTGTQLQPKIKTFQMRETTELFRGRSQKDFENLQKLFLNNKVVVIFGETGVGKSEMARKFAWDNKEFFNCNLIWINSESKETISQSLSFLGQQLNIIPNSGQVHDAIILQIVHEIYAIYEMESCLFIFDNAKRIDDVKNFFPLKNVHKNVHVLVTCQYFKEEDNINYFQLENLSAEASLEVVQVLIPENYYFDSELWIELLKQLENNPFSIHLIMPLIISKFKENGNTNEDQKQTVLKEFIEHLKLKKVLVLNEAIENTKSQQAIDILNMCAFLNNNLIKIQDFELVTSFNISSQENLKQLINNTTIISYKHEVKTIFMNHIVQLLLIHRQIKKNETKYFEKVLNILVNNCEFAERHCTTILKYINYSSHFSNIVKRYIESSDNTVQQKIIFRYLSYSQHNVILEKMLVDSNQNDIDNMLLLAVLNFNNNFNTIKFLIGQGAKPILRYEYIKSGELKEMRYNSSIYRQNTLEVALKRKSAALLKYLLNINDFNTLLIEMGGRALHILIISYKNESEANNIIECLDFLIARKVDPNTLDQFKRTLLHSAAMVQSPSILKYLLEKPECKTININAKGEFDDHLTAIQTLFQYYDGHKGEINKTIKCAKYLLQYNADVTIKDNVGRTLLFYVADIKNAELMKFIVNINGCDDINIKDTNEKMAINRIFQNCNPTIMYDENQIEEIFRFFIEKNVTFTDEVLNLARRRNYETVVRLIEEHKSTNKQP